MRAPNFWYRPNGGIWASLLAPLGWGYGLVAGVRATRTQPTRVPPSVICIGNLTVGGAGKTPVALSIADRLRTQNFEVHFLTRGYGGNTNGPTQVDPDQGSIQSFGDEALLLAREGPTWVSADRARGAQAAAKAGASVIVMDDGFQNPGLAKDLSILVFDGRDGIGNGRLMPAGPMREGLAKGLARAQAAVILGEDSSEIGALLAKQLGRGKPILQATIDPAPEALALADQDVIAFAGIGRPEKFFKTLEELGCRIVARVPYADHHQYRDKDVSRLRHLASQHQARLVTTTKDAVRLPTDFKSEVAVVEIAVVWKDPDQLDALLGSIQPTTNMNSRG